MAATCTSASDCWTVGDINGNANYQTLIERWDGTSWGIVNSPNTSSTQFNLLTGVACISAAECWAVGYSNNGNAYQTLIERWDGTSWAIVPSANTSATHDNILYGMTCVSASNCWAVGYYTTDSFYAQTLVLHWDGTAWSIVTSPSTSSTQANFLYGVSCVSASDCWAAGYSYTNSGVTFQTLIEHWDGAAWTIVPSANTSPAQTNVLLGVTCASGLDCWAVGYVDVDVPNVTHTSFQTLIERWDGSSWAIVSSPNTGAAQTQSNALYGVQCLSQSECWAVGYYINADGTYQTLIERWNGTSWGIVNSPNTSSTQFNLLNSVTCASGSECWAVGYADVGVGFYQTLIERYTASPPPVPTKVVSRKAHAPAGDFDINLPLTGSPGIECRQGQGTNSNEHRVVLTFSAPATVSSAACDGTPAATSTSGNDVTVNCTGVANAKLINVTLAGVTVGASSGNVTVPMAVLIGDTNADGFVNSADIAQTKSQSGITVTSSNFREDVNAEGSINSADIALVKSTSGTALP
jgi:hypothetical protein